MNDIASAGSIYDGVQDEVVTESTETTVEEVVAQTEEPTGETTEATAEVEAAPPAEEQPYDAKSEVEQLKKQLHASIAQANDERSKRQALQQQQVEVPDAYVEPDKAIEFATQQAVSQADQRFLNYAFENAKDKWDDFLEMQDVFFDEVAAQNPALVQQAQQQPDPYKFIYQQAKKHSEFKGIESVDDLRSKIEAEVRAQIAAESGNKEKAAVEKAINDAIPTTLSKSTAAGGNTSKAWSPTPTSEIFPD